MGTAVAGGSFNVAVEDADKKDEASPHGQIFCTINDFDDDLQADPKESQNYENSVDCIVPTCSGFGICDTYRTGMVENIAKNKKYATCRTVTCSFISGYMGAVQRPVEIFASEHETINYLKNDDEAKNNTCMKYEVLEVQPQNEYMGLIRYLSYGPQLVCFFSVITMIYKYRSVLKPKPIELKERIKRQSKDLPPERRKFIRLPGDGASCNEKAGSLFFKCKWLLVSFLVAFNPVMCESLISATFGDVENLDGVENGIFTGGMEMMSTVDAQTNVKQRDISTCRNEIIQLKDEIMDLSETIAMLGHKNVHDGTSSDAVPVRDIVDIGMEIKKMKENNYRHQRLVLKKLFVEKHASTIDFFRQKRFDPCRSTSLVEKIDDFTKHVVPLVSSKMLCEEFNLFEKLMLENEEKEDVNQDRNQRVLVVGQETKVKRRNLVACSTFLFADDAALSGTDGYNVLTASCTMGSDMTVGSGKMLKIKKDPSVVGEIVLDRQATDENRGRHFLVLGTIVMEGITLKGGYAPVSYISSYILLLIIYFHYSLTFFFFLLLLFSSLLTKLLLRSFAFFISV